jgi:hypothetical protein
MGNRDKLREAIQRLSPQAQRRREYTHPGWRQVDDSWCFLTQDAVIGPEGPVDGIVVRLEGPSASIRLPAPPATADLPSAFASTIGLLDLAPDRLMVPLLGGVFRALLNQIAPADVVLFLVGPSGVMKSELAAVVQRCFGPDFDRLKLPASWASTANALERIAFDFKDCLLVIDDFAPSGTQHDVQKYHMTADRVIRGAGNASGRGRMKAEGPLRESYPPRALLLGTGEDVPRGYSIRARMLVLEVGKDDVDASLLATYQHGPDRSRPGLMLAGYIRWLAGNMDRVRHDYGPAAMKLRADLQSAGTHARTPDALAGIGVAWRLWIRYARETGYLTKEQGHMLWHRVWAALLELARSQADHLVQENPVQRFLDLLAACIASGAAHVAGPAGDEPSTPEAWGWRERIIGTGEYTRQEWQPQGKCVGWLDESGLYLEPSAAYQAVQQFGSSAGSSLTVSAPTLWKRMDEAGLLRSTDLAVRETRLVRRTFAGARRKVLHLRLDALAPESATGASQAEEPEEEDESTAPGRVFGSGFGTKESEPDHKMQPELPLESGFGRVGRVGRVNTGGIAREEESCVYCHSPLAPGQTYVCTSCRAERKDPAA